MGWASGSVAALAWSFGRWVGAWCLSAAGPAMARLGVFFGSDCLWVVGPFLCFVVGCWFDWGVFHGYADVGWVASVWAERFLCFGSGGGLVQVGCILASGGLGCCPFWGGGSVVVGFLFIVAPDVGVCGCSVFCCALLCVHSSIAIILMGKRELVALLNLSSWCLLVVGRLFLAVPRGCLQFVIVVFPYHTHLLFLIYEYMGPFICAQEVYVTTTCEQTFSV